MLICTVFPLLLQYLSISFTISFFNPFCSYYNTIYIIQQHMQPLNLNLKQLSNRNQSSIFKNTIQSQRQHNQQKDSLLQFQNQLQLLRHHKDKQKSIQQHKLKQRQRQRQIRSKNIRMKTEMKSHPQTQVIRKQVHEIRDKINSQREFRKVQTKLDKLLWEIQAINNRNQHKQPQQTNPYHHYPQTIIYPTPNINIHNNEKPYEEQMSKRNKRISNQPYRDKMYTQYSSYPQKQQHNQHRNAFAKVKSKNKILSKFRIVAFVAFFPHVLKKQSKKIAKNRKMRLHKFWKDRFDEQMRQLRNWLVGCHKKQIVIILEKGALDFLFFTKAHTRIRQSVQRMVIRLMGKGIDQLRNKVQNGLTFIQLLERLCSRGTYAIGQFWTREQLRCIRVSQLYGCLVLDDDMEKYLLGVLVFIKVLIFNMFVQPHKFDELNFHIHKHTLRDNMKLIASVYYMLIKQVLKEFLKKSKHNKKHITKSNSYGSSYTSLLASNKSREDNSNRMQTLMVGEQQQIEQGQLICGLYTQKQIGCLKEYKEWTQYVTKVKEVIESMHKQMKHKMKQRKKQQIHQQ